MVNNGRRNNFNRRGRSNRTVARAVRRTGAIQNSGNISAPRNILNNSILIPWFQCTILDTIAGKNEKAVPITVANISNLFSLYFGLNVASTHIVEFRFIGVQVTSHNSATISVANPIVLTVHDPTVTDSVQITTIRSAINNAGNNTLRYIWPKAISTIPVKDHSRTVLTIHAPASGVNAGVYFVKFQFMWRTSNQFKSSTSTVAYEDISTLFANLSVSD